MSTSFKSITTIVSAGRIHVVSPDVEIKSGDFILSNGTLFSVVLPKSNPSPRIKASDSTQFDLYAHLGPEHNPDNLTPEQVGVKDGWRLLRKGELRDRGECTPLIERHKGDGHWADQSYGSTFSFTYRTKLTPEELAKLP